MKREKFTCNSFIFYGSFYEAVRELPKADQSDVYEAIFKFAFEGEEIELSGLPYAIFALIKPQLVANRARYENGCRGGAPRGNSNAKKTTEKQPKNNLGLNLEEQKKTTEKQPNQNENQNDNVNAYIKRNTPQGECKEKQAVVISPASRKIVEEKQKHGVYGRVRLTPSEYQRLIADLGADTAERAIKGIDESIQSTNNKNGWIDHNLVIRRAVREQWACIDFKASINTTGGQSGDRAKKRYPDSK